MWWKQGARFLARSFLPLAVRVYLVRARLVDPGRLFGGFTWNVALLSRKALSCPPPQVADAALLPSLDNAARCRAHLSDESSAAPAY